MAIVNSVVVKIIRHIFIRIRVVDPPPAKTELISNCDDPLIIFRIIFLKTSLDQPLQKSVVFADASIRPSGLAISHACIKYFFASSVCIRFMASIAATRFR